ncbi:MAG: TonB-dependent receptor, partial [Myxococcota bacterium]
IAPTLTQIDGEFRTDRETAQTLQVTADRSLLSAVIGLEYDFALFSERWTTNAFGKWYGLEGQTDVPESVLGSRTEFDVSTFGAGTVTRLRLAGPLDAEASYEFATRLPNPSEYFGTPGAIQPNTNLEPETAHNFNLGLKLNPWNTSIGSFRGEVNGFMRDTSNLIRLEAAASIFFRYGNVTSARSLGGEAALGWTSPGRYLNLNGSLTYMDYRNTSDSGRDAAFNGDRIPNAPYLFGSGTVRFRFSEILQKSDTVELSYSTRFVEEFFLTWESAGEAEFKRRIETQIEASVNLGYRFEVLDQSAAVAVDVQNVFDERLFDFFGIQRPGRAVFVRVSMDALL